MSKISKVASLFLSMFMVLSINAQDTLLLETFNDTLGQFTPYSEVGDGEMWRPSDFNDKFFAQMNGFNGGVQENIDWLVSPALDMDVYEDEILNFENASNFDGPDLELLYSIDYDGAGDPTTATWTDITSAATWSPGGYEYVLSGNIDLSAVDGIAYIAFRYTSSTELGGKLFQIDSLGITANTMISSLFNSSNKDRISAPYVSNDNLVFSVLEGSQDVRVSISSMDGKLVSQFNNTAVEGEVVLPLADLTMGAYVLIVSSEGAVKSYKFVK